MSWRLPIKQEEFIFRIFQRSLCPVPGCDERWSLIFMLFTRSPNHQKSPSEKCFLPGGRIIIKNLTLLKSFIFKYFLRAIHSTWVVFLPWQGLPWLLIWPGA